MQGLLSRFGTDVSYSLYCCIVASRSQILTILFVPDNSLIPRDEGFLDREHLYDCYHQLNHYNLFGGGYIGSARGHLESLKKKLDLKEKAK